MTAAPSRAGASLPGSIHRRAVVVSLLLAIGAATGCGLFGGGASDPEPVVDPRIVAFGQRIDGFYRRLEGLPLDMQITFEDEKLRSYFANESEFSAYYADLARQVRGRLFRNSTAVRIDIVEFREEREDRIVVDVKFFGEHRRRLRRGQIEYMREDTWRFVDGGWVLTPARL